MKKILIFILLFITQQVFAECMAVGVKQGSKIPTYWVTSKESINHQWESYVANKKHPFIPEIEDPESIENICLVNIVRQVNKNYIDFSNSEKVILKKNCANISIGKKYRMHIGHYCVELTNNFYMSIPYRHGSITNKRRY